MTWYSKPRSTLAVEQATKFASLALAHVRREYPNKLDHIMFSSADVQSPRSLHPVFYGSFDWHSCVHGYWLLARLLRRVPALQQAGEIRALFAEQFTPDKMRAEVEYAAHDARGTFERPYGWAWVLMLASELAQHETDEAKQWKIALSPLTNLFVQRFVAFLPKATYPIRVGTHFNSAFALTLVHEYCATTSEPAVTGELEQLCGATVRRWFARDVSCQAWEPGGDDFLSSALMEAECMRRWLGVEWEAWFSAFLPHIAKMEPRTLFEPAMVSDRSDGKIAHLDGLNLSRAWCWRSLAHSLPVNDRRRTHALEAANVHLEASLPHIAGDYMGEHWLATFALLALDV